MHVCHEATEEELNVLASTAPKAADAARLCVMLPVANVQYTYTI